MNALNACQVCHKEVEEKVYKEEKIKPYFPPIKNTISLNDYIVAEPEQTDTEHRGKVKKILYRKYCDTCLFHKRNKKFYDRLNIDITKHTRKSLQTKLASFLNRHYVENKLTLREIANKLKIPLKTLYSSFKKTKIKTRNHKESMDLAVKKGRQITIFRLGQERKKKEKIDEVLIVPSIILSSKENLVGLTEKQISLIEKFKEKHFLDETDLSGVKAYEVDPEYYHKENKNVWLIPSSETKENITKDKNWNKFQYFKDEEGKNGKYIFLSAEGEMVAVPLSERGKRWQENLKKQEEEKLREKHRETIILKNQRDKALKDQTFENQFTEEHQKEYEERYKEIWGS